MKPMLAIAAAAMLALAGPALAQSTNTPAAPTGNASGAQLNPADPNTPHGNMNGTTNGMKSNENGMSEGRAVAPEAPAGDKADQAPNSVRGDQNNQGTAK